MSYKFSDKSKKRLETCHQYLILLMNHVIKKIDITILEGHRNEEKQNNYYNAGKSKLKYPESKHNKTPSQAVDVALWHKEEPNIRWDDKTDWYYLAGYIESTAKDLNIPIYWGGRFSNFFDGVHFQLDL